MTVTAEIQALIDRETDAWNTQDAEALVELFHRDTVWPWPPDADSHNPETWVMPMGRFNRTRWIESWKDLFASHELVHNQRRTVKIVVTPEEDGAFAVVDVDTLWKNRKTSQSSHWRGRACKVYTKTEERWYFMFQTGLLNYQN